MAGQNRFLRKQKFPKPKDFKSTHLTGAAEPVASLPSFLLAKPICQPNVSNVGGVQLHVAAYNPRFSTRTHLILQQAD